MLFNSQSLLHFYRSKLFVAMALSLLLLPSCSFFSSKNKARKPEYSENRARMEMQALERLSEARRLLAENRCGEARATLQKMRKECYLALDARTKGILLMDSIDWYAAKAELAKVDSLLRVQPDSVGPRDFEEACRKVEFYERKIQHDQSK